MTKDASKISPPQLETLNVWPLSKHTKERVEYWRQGKQHYLSFYNCNLDVLYDANFVDGQDMEAETHALATEAYNRLLELAFLIRGRFKIDPDLKAVLNLISKHNG